jgi:hypothetical protein
VDGDNCGWRKFQGRRRGEKQCRNLIRFFSILLKEPTKPRGSRGGRSILEK